MRASLLVSDNGVDLGTVVTFNTETDVCVGFEVVTVVRDGSFINESELVCRDTVSVRYISVPFQGVVQAFPRPPRVGPKGS